MMHICTESYLKGWSKHCDEPGHTSPSLTMCQMGRMQYRLVQFDGEIVLHVGTYQHVMECVNDIGAYDMHHNTPTKYRVDYINAAGGVQHLFLLETCGASMSSGTS